MKVRSKEKNINIITLGCSKNVYDSEVLATNLKNNDFNVAFDETSKNEEITIINTCGFIESAKEESINTILKYSLLRKEGIIQKLYVVGCLSQRYKTELENEISGVDKFFGTKSLFPLLKELKNDFKKTLLSEQTFSTPNHFSYLKISEGCNRTCSFCAIPLIRGKHVSIPIEEIVASARKSAEKGVKELILVAQDLTFYGLDIYKKRKLHVLLQELCKIEKIKWIRLHYAYPTGFTNDVISVMRDEPKICNYLDIPLQHINDEVLKAMKRGYSRNRVESLLQKLREAIPNISIRSTIITGFPGETEEQFLELLEWVKTGALDKIGGFIYSHEEDTSAFKLDDTMKKEKKEERLQQIMDAQFEVAHTRNQSFVGTTQKVLIDTSFENSYSGRMEYDSPEVDNEVTIISKNKKLKEGEFYSVKILSATAYDFSGKVLL